jgi:ribonuclease D
VSSSGKINVADHATFERRVLARVGLGLEGVVDTLAESKRVRGKDAFGGHRLAVVCERELGVRLHKGVQTSNWGCRSLDAEQLRYAALDAEVLLRLRERL